MKRRIGWPTAGFLAGTVFGLGLGTSQMTNPEKVLGFLNITGAWDPSLLLTMASAIVVTSIGYRLVLRRGALLNDTLHLPTRSDIDVQLVVGSLLFGVGWGIAGYCPGPAITGITGGLAEPFIFIVAMMVGSELMQLWPANSAKGIQGQ